MDALIDEPCLLHCKDILLSCRWGDLTAICVSHIPFLLVVPFLPLC